MGEQPLLLDSALRNWVLLPITVVMIMVGVLRNNLMQFLESPPKPAKLASLRQRNILARSAALRANYLMLLPSSVAMRRTFLTKVLNDGSYLAPETKATIEKEKNRKPDDMPEIKNPLADSNTMDMMMDQAKKSMVMMIPQTAIMGWINFFFSGFVLRFKVMLQRDIAANDLSVEWVSSLSWYFLNLYGLDAIYTLLLGGAAMMMQEQMPGQVDYVKLHTAEKDSLELMGAIRKNDSVSWVGEGIESRVLALYA
ncbi:hypothetical protein MYAM1_002936 [Malassezia yamatoensis]|uniref:ER membrane protein complex subunit 3 n=1 Tax=Malassezia yamatoensis TaxID=253288 RepID=A0AAJ5YT23_9BASI|nr:hypothetical protein MYAM1_002936 [Malassezia yamatoensis]